MTCVCWRTSRARRQCARESVSARARESSTPAAARWCLLPAWVVRGAERQSESVADGTERSLLSSLLKPSSQRRSSSSKKFYMLVMMIIMMIPQFLNRPSPRVPSHDARRFKDRRWNVQPTSTTLPEGRRTYKKESAYQFPNSQLGVLAVS